MNTKIVKKASEITLDGITVELHIVDAVTKGITLRDAKGFVLTVANNGWGSGVDILVPAPPVMVKRFQVAGTLKGIEFREVFEEEYKALARVTELGPDADPIEMKQIEIAEVA